MFFKACLLQTKPNSWAIDNSKILKKISISEFFIDAKVEAGPGQVGVGGAQEQAEAGEGQQVLSMILVI